MAFIKGGGLARKNLWGKCYVYRAVRFSTCKYCPLHERF